MGAAGLAGGLLIAAWLAIPRVTEQTPAPASQTVSGKTGIAIGFDQPMNRLSVESRVVIAPTLAGRFSWQGNRLLFEPDQPWPAGTELQVRLKPGATSARGLPMLTGVEWAFRTSRPRLVYLWPANAPADLYARDPTQAEATRLTHSANGIQAFSVGEAGGAIAYAALRDDGGTDLHRLAISTGEDQSIYSCPAGSTCVSPSLSPDGRWLAFELASLVSGSSGRPQLGPTQVWLLDVRSAVMARSVAAADHVTSLPTWSPSGLLEFYDSSMNALTMIDPSAAADSQPVLQVPSGLGDPGSWSPDGAYLAFPDLVFPAQTPIPTTAAPSSAESLPVFYSHIQRLSIARGTLSELTSRGAGLVEDASPAYSPDGQWIAFGRKYLEPSRWTLGRQLWLMRADGSQAKPLTNQPSINYSAFAWSPDSTTLAYLRFDEGDFNKPSEIWWMEIAQGVEQQLVVGGYSPEWIP